VDWNDVDLSRLAAQLRTGHSEEEAERMIVAFEHALALARADAAFLDDLLVAVVCLLARAEGSTPRDVLDTCFRRSITDARWRSELAPLLAAR
jgi:hypothetical protein